MAHCSHVSIPFRVLVEFLLGANPIGKERRKKCFNPFQGFGGVSASKGMPLLGPFGKLCFNPFQGFGGVSAGIFPVLHDDWEETMFQSLSGFWWSFCKGARVELSDGKLVVSIPFRVLVEFLRGLRRPFGKRCSGSYVSIPFRVLVEFLQKLAAVRASLLRRVSIPFRVLVEFLRQVGRGSPFPFPSRFNPFQGFGGVSAGGRGVNPRPSVGSFNPFQGFGGVSASTWLLGCYKWGIAFQSLSGFWWSFCITTSKPAKTSHAWFQSLSGFWWSFCKLPPMLS